jgi:hypothetical protein
VWAVFVGVKCCAAGSWLGCSWVVGDRLIGVVCCVCRVEQHWPMMLAKLDSRFVAGQPAVNKHPSGSPEALPAAAV